MADDLRITIDELRRRMEAGEDFAFIDTRNPQAWAQLDVMLPEAIRVPAVSSKSTCLRSPRINP